MPLFCAVDLWEDRAEVAIIANLRALEHEGGRPHCLYYEFYQSIVRPPCGVSKWTVNCV